MKKLKVMFAAPVPPPYGGIGNWVLLMQRYLIDHPSIELSDIVNTGPKSRTLDGRTFADRVIGQGLEMFRQNRKMKERIAANRPDILHITTSGSMAIVRDLLLLHSAKKLGIPAFYHIRFGRIPIISEKNTLEWKLMHRAVLLSARTIAIDHKTADALRKYFPGGKILEIPNPFDVKQIRVPPKTADSKTALFVGWCIKTKGIEELLEAWKAVVAEHPDWTLRIIGPGEETYVQSLKDRFSMDHVEMLGEQPHDKVLEDMNTASVFILPSYTEGFPNAVLEAMALEKPIIATNVGAISDMLSNKAGIVIPPKDSAAIVNALNQLLSDEVLRNELAANARQRLLENYEVNVVVRQYEEAWRSVLA